MILHTTACKAESNEVKTISPTSNVSTFLSVLINEQLNSNIWLKLLSLRIGLIISFISQK